jgi:receptor protein-tyrosine kinase
VSIIEEAARRLQQLRQAKGLFQAPESPQPLPPQANPPAPRERRSDEVRAVAAASSELPQSGNRHEISRKVEVDLVQLAAKGIITPDAPRSQVADEYRILKRPLLGNAQGKGQAPVDRGNLIMVTSSVPGEGKTFTAINLAISIAMELDNTVLLVDADVSRPSVLNVLGLPAARGLMDVLLDDDLDLGDVMLKTNIEKLTLVPVGSAAKRATELLASEAMTRLLEEMATRYSDRIIIFDSPPLLVTTEAPVLATHVGQVLMVVEAERTPQSVVKQALATIQSCPVVLTMLNKASSVGSGTYYDYYGYYGGGYGAFGDGAT